MRTWKPGVAVVGLSTLAGLVGVAGAQETRQGQQPTVQQQLDELRRRNDALEARVAEFETVHASADEDAATGLVFSYGEATATFYVFGDVGFRYENPEPAGQAESSFYLGSVDLFANVQLGDHFRVLTESVLENRSGESVTIEQERLWAMWTVSDALYLKLGTEHSPVSRWNQLYHHGRWLETAVTRPLVAAFEGDGGILAMHATGLELGGSFHPDAGAVSWFATVSNGRGLDPTQKQRSFDRNISKKLDLGLAFEPAAARDLRLGTAFSFDEVPADPSSTVPGRSRSIRELVAAGNLQYRLGPIDLIGELAWIEHDVRALDMTTDHNAGYLQAAWRIGAFTPFARFDYRQMQRGDAFYVAQDRDLDAWRQVFGVRYDAAENLATKLEVGLGRAETRDAGGAVREADTVAVELQVAWVF